MSILLNFCLVENAMSQMGEEGGGERFGEECTDLTMELLAEDGGEFTFFFFFENGQSNPPPTCLELGHVLVFVGTISLTSPY